MITPKEAIKHLEDLFDRKVTVLSGEVMKLAISALEEQERRSSNNPLTLEEIRQMDGEPVYLLSEHDWGGWGIVEIPKSGRWKNVPFFTRRHNSVSHVINIEETDLELYRYKPQNF